MDFWERPLSGTIKTVWTCWDRETGDSFLPHFAYLLPSLPFPGLPSVLVVMRSSSTWLGNGLPPDFKEIVLQQDLRRDCSYP